MVQMKKVAMVACVKAKRDEPSPASRLYESTWFRKARAYAETKADTWRILSAKHGVLDPREVIAPYDTSLHDFPASKRREWADGVVKSLDRLLDSGDEVIILAGRRYREYLTGPLRERGCEVSVPMEGLGIGEQLQFLSEALD